MFRIIQRADDNKLEIQFEKQALEVRHLSNERRVRLVVLLVIAQPRRFPSPPRL